MADESAVIKRVLEGDRSAFREIVDQHGETLYRLAFRLTGNARDAEDLSQEVFIRAYQALKDFRGEAKLSSWLYRIAVNMFLDGEGRHKNAMMVLDDRAGEEPADTTADPGRLASSSVLQAHIWRALLTLSPRERAVFVLRHYQELSLNEVAEALSIRPGTVKALLFRAVRKMQKELSFYRKDVAG